MKYLIGILTSLSGLSLLALAFLNAVALPISIHMGNEGPTYQGWSHQVTGAILAVVGASALMLCLLAAAWQLFKAKPRLVAIASGLTLFHLMAIFGSMFASLVHVRLVGDVNPDYVAGVQTDVATMALKTLLIIGLLLIPPTLRNVVMPAARPAA